MKNQGSNIKTIVGTSFFSGLIIMFVVMYWLTGPHYAYSQSMDILQTKGYTFLQDGVLMYSTQNNVLSNEELESLTKLSTIYVIEIDMPSYFEMNADNLSSNK